MRSKLLILLLLCSGFGFAQISDEQLLAGYLSQDLSSWTTYISTAQWEQLSNDERTRLINYEYGYIPFMADQNAPNCRALLDAYWQHLEAHKSVLTPSQYTAYCASAHAYEYLLDKSKIFTSGMQSFKLAKQAVEMDSLNPIALSLKGNVDFYAPKLFGGSKARAMELFARAEQLMQADAHYRYLWNLPALQLAIAQCEEKLGNKDKALKKTQQILHDYPSFIYVKEVYLPTLQSKKE